MSFHAVLCMLLSACCFVNVSQRSTSAAESALTTLKATPASHSSLISVQIQACSATCCHRSVHCTVMYKTYCAAVLRLLTCPDHREEPRQFGWLVQSNAVLSSTVQHVLAAGPQPRNVLAIDLLLYACVCLRSGCLYQPSPWNSYRSSRETCVAVIRQLNSLWPVFDTIDT